MMVLILLPQSLEDLDRFLDRGRLDDDSLEAALERPILLDVLPILVERGGADALQFTASEGGA